MEINEKELPFEQRLELLKLKNEQTKFKFEVFKWAIIAFGAIITFYIIDYGKLKLEESRADAENFRELLTSYVNSTETSDPDVWMRKLRLIKSYSNKNDTVIKWAEEEMKYIREKAALIALYKETADVAVILANRHNYRTETWSKNYIRFYGLYHADLVFYKESEDVESAMVKFKRMLDQIEENEDVDWNRINQELLTLIKTLSNESNKLINN